MGSKCPICVDGILLTPRFKALLRVYKRFGVGNRQLHCFFDVLPGPAVPNKWRRVPPSGAGMKPSPKGQSKNPKAAIVPPSTCKVVPVIARDRSLARKS